MSTTHSVDGAAAPAGQVPAPARRSSALWAATGALAGIAGIVGMQASASLSATMDEGVVGNAVAMMNRMAEQRTLILVEHVAMTGAALLLLVFAAGLCQRLAGSLEPSSLLPQVAAGGLILTAAACLIGTGLTTELVFGLSEGDQLLPEFAAVGAHWMGTIPWLWAGAGVSAIAVAVASLRHGALPRWIGWTSAVLGAVTALFGISPLQYMAGFTGPVWVLVCAVGLWFSGRSARA
ncbi:hypothetical protein [Rhodococcus sp. NPDC058514]|uniref:hypothetical protein n=1 Tax=unclassified Rhodococcus (in: high G+C Gram-positive bacteria) TaxID=192944 RepID=UPI00365EA547